MRNIVLLTGLLVLCIANFVSAASLNSAQKIGIVVITADSTFKTKQFNDKSKEAFKGMAKNLEVFNGDAVQSKYDDYWLEKGLLEEGKPTKEDFISFVSFGEYDKVIYLLVRDVVIDGQGEGGVGIASPLGNTTVYSNTGGTGANLTVRAFLCDKNKVVKTVSVTRDTGQGNEFASKLIAFKRCVKSISEDFKSAI